MANESPSGLPVYALIGNIPHDYHSADLRRFFSHFIEDDGFDCFHFRHRPEGEMGKETSAQLPPVKAKDNHVNKVPKKTCCVVRLKQQKLNELVQLYHKKHWIDSKGKSIPSLCFISRIKQNVDPDPSTSKSSFNNPGHGGSADCDGSEINKNDSNTPNGQIADIEIADIASKSDSRSNSQPPSFSDADSQTQAEKALPPVVGKGLTVEDISSLKELQPPAVMPNGNVGTPSKVFLELIKACKLPPKVIGKLGLTFPKSHSRRIYGTIKLDYENIHKPRKGAQSTKASTTSPSGDCGRDHSASCELGYDSSASVKANESSGPTAETDRLQANSRDQSDVEKTDSEDDADDCEEWERHEALHDDPANYERNKERVYEEELEVVWEKGGPGLVWYTDEKYWREQQGDFDEQTADDWDVDMSVYYDPTGGDYDSRQLVEMRREKRRRQGFKDDPDVTSKIGKFEKYTKGIGRKVLERQGWTDGTGLGSSRKGMAEALDNDGQAPTDKRGFGYYGEKINRYGSTSQPVRRKRRDAEDVLISTVYDNPADLEIPESLLRRTDHNTMKYKAKKYQPSKGKPV